MSAPIPASKPQASLATVAAAAESAWRQSTGNTNLPALYVLAVRAYYRDSMGAKGKNDVGMYDDAFFIVSGNRFSSWNGNTDPSRYGWNPNADGYMARLKTGVWWMERRMHRGKYLAYGQGESPVTIDRVKQDGSVAKTVTGCYGINLHHGGFNGTSSEGCQTVPVQQWNAFDTELAEALVKGKVKRFPFILIDGPIN